MILPEINSIQITGMNNEGKGEN